MTIRAALFAMLLLLPTPSFAQGMIDPSPQSVSALDSGVACSVANSCASWNISGAPSVTMQVVGTFSGTLTFEATADGQTWFSVTVTRLSGATTSTTTTTTGQFSLTNTGVQGFRARMTSYSSGGANVSLTRGTASARGGTLPQDLSTTGTPQFAREGLGVAAGSTALLTLNGGGIIAPSADSTAAVRFTRTDASTNVLTLDTTNGNVVLPNLGGIAPVTGTFFLGSSNLTISTTGTFNSVTNFAAGAGFGVDSSGSGGNSHWESAAILGWNTTTAQVTTSAFGTFDTGLARNAAGVMEVNSGTANQYRDIAARTYFVNGGTTRFATAATTAANPTGTTSTTLVMMGLAGSITTQTGRIFFCASGNLSDGSANDGTKVQLSYGTSTAPTNGAALTGTQVGSVQQYNASTLAAGAIAPFNTCALITGLAVATTYWLDIAVAAITGGTGAASSVVLAAYDIP